MSLLQSLKPAFVALVVSVCAMAQSALAHPHVWVDVKTELLFDDKGRLSGFRHDWRFDEGYSAFAVTGLDKDKDGKLSRAELAPLAKVNIESLGEFGYFTHLTVDKAPADLLDPTDYELKYTDSRAVLSFTLPLKKPVDGRRHAIDFAVYDATIFVDFAFVKVDPVRLSAKAPGLCRIDRESPPKTSDKNARLSEYSEEDFNNPDKVLDLNVQYADKVRLLCGKIHN